MSVEIKNLIERLARDVENGSSYEDVVKTFRSVGEDEFSSKNHYIYYKHYLLRKLSMIGKIYRYSRWGAETKKRFNLAIGIGKTYAVVEFIKCVKDEGKEPDCYRAFSYLIGVNSDGKLFINKVDFGASNLSIYGESMHDLVVGKSKIYMYIISDYEVKRMLGFTYENENSEVTIDRSGMYRVQGEIVLDVDMLNLDRKEAEDKYIYRIESLLTFPMQYYVEYLLTDHIARILSEMGFNVRYRDRHLVIDGAIDRKREELDIAAIMIALSKKLREESHEVVYIDRERREMEINSELFGKYGVSVKRHVGRFGERYKPVKIEVWIMRCGNICSEIAIDIDAHLRESNLRNTYRYLVGGHIVTLKDVMSSSITYTPAIKPLILRERQITVESDWFYADESSEIELIHREHGVTKIRLAKPSFIRITTTRVDRSYQQEQNRVALSILKEDREYREVARYIRDKNRLGY